MTILWTLEGTLVDLGDLGIAHEALEGILTGVAVAAGELQAAAGHVAGGLAETYSLPIAARWLQGSWSCLA